MKPISIGKSGGTSGSTARDGFVARTVSLKSCPQSPPNLFRSQNTEELLKGAYIRDPQLNDGSSSSNRSYKVGENIVSKFTRIALGE